MGFVVGKLKCWFCSKKAGVLQSVHEYGIYGGVGGRIHYHQECLEMVEVAPEKFGHRITDKAVKINDLRKRNEKNFNKYIIEKFEKKVASLHQSNFERMMPK